MENKPEFDKNFFEQLLNKKLKPTLFKKYIKLLFINMNNGCFSEFKYNEDKGLKLDLFITYKVIDNFNDGNKKKNKPKKVLKWLKKEWLN